MLWAYNNYIPNITKDEVILTVDNIVLYHFNCNTSVTYRKNISKSCVMPFFHKISLWPILYASTVEITRKRFVLTLHYILKFLMFDNHQLWRARLKIIVGNQTIRNNNI